MTGSKDKINHRGVLYAVIRFHFVNNGDGNVEFC